MEHALILIADFILVAVSSFLWGRMYERQYGIFKKAYEDVSRMLDKVLKETKELLEDILEQGQPKKRADGSVVSPIQIKKF